MIIDNLDYLIGVITGMWWMYNLPKPLPIKVTQLPPEEPREPYKEWTKIMEPFVRKMTVAGALGYDYRFNPKGATAFAKLLKEASSALDFAVDNHMVKPKKEPKKSLTTKQ